jgi:hypothetical protein
LEAANESAVSTNGGCLVHSSIPGDGELLIFVKLA